MTCVLWEKLNFVVNKNRLYNLLLRGWFRIKGRSSRKEYILRFSMMWCLGFIFNAFDNFHQFFNKNNYFDNRFIIISFLFVSFTIIAVFFLSVVQVFFVTHRRLHDLNASGWWQLVTFIPFGQILMIGFIFFKGTPGTNKYGEPPSY